MTKIETLSDTVVATEGFLTLVKRAVRVDSAVVERHIVLHPGAVVVIPLMADGRMLFVRQFRSAVGETVLEFPAGKRDVVGERKEVTATRELAEECGLTARVLTDLGEIYNSPGFTNETTEIFVATGLAKVSRQPDSPEESAMEFVVLDSAQLAQTIERGELKDGKSLVALLWLQRWLGENGARQEQDSQEVQEWLVSLTP